MRRRIAVTLSIFNFSSRFLAQIVENRRGHLSRPFLSPRDNFSKSYDENQIRSERAPPRVYTAGSAWAAARAAAQDLVRRSLAVLYDRSVFVITFRKIIPMT